MGSILKILKICPVKSPERTGFNAGFDFFTPSNFNQKQPYRLISGDHIPIPSGIKVKIPENHALVAFNKSGIATKLGLQIGACVIDENYTGQIFLHIINFSPKDVFIKPDMKIAQFLLIPVNYSIVKEVSNEEEMDWVSSERGEKGFGSTGW